VQDASEEFKATFAAARGDKGARLQENVAKMSKVLKEARAGEAREEIMRLVNF
jgi:urease gamma subunit